MDIGIGLPSVVPGVQGRELLDWARRAEGAGFASLGTIDRIVYHNYEPLVALSAAAAVTERVRLTTAIALLPVRQNAGLFAKQAATIQHISGGRLVLGLAVGGREDDYEGTGAEFAGRGERFEQMLPEIKATWAGEERGFAGAIGPDVSERPPSLIIGGQVDAAYRRAAEFGDGWMAGGGPPEAFPEGREKAERAFRKAGRSDPPRVMALSYFALGNDPEGDVRRSIHDYYSFAPPYADMVAEGTAKSADELAERVRRFEENGCDELILFPASSDPRQVDLLAAAVLS